MSTMKWSNYLEYLLKNEGELGSIRVSLDNGDSYIGIPPIIEVTIYMLDSILKNNGKYQIFVFPEKDQSYFLFALAFLLHNIITGNISTEYDPHKFVKGEKLKIGNAVIEFVELENRDGAEYIVYRLGDGLTINKKLSTVPFLQKTNTNKKLSSFKLYSKEIKKLKNDDEENYVTRLKKYKTHMQASIYSVSSLASIKDRIAECKIEQENLEKILMLSTANYEGKLNNIGGGQAAGIPAMVFASDLYSTNEAISNNAKPKSVIIDVSNTNSILGQLDELDELIKQKIPIIGITDTMNSIDLGLLEERGFRIWRWDTSSLTLKLYKNKSVDVERKAHNLVKQEVKYLTSECQEISNSIKKLSLHRKETQELSAQIMKVYSTLYGLSFAALRSIVPFDGAIINTAQQRLDECKRLLYEEKRFISKELYADYIDVANCLIKVFNKDFGLVKIKAMESFLDEQYSLKICVVIPEKSDKKQTQLFWENNDYVVSNNHELTVLYPGEYYATREEKYDITIVVGWLKRVIMRKIIFSYNTMKYLVLLYDYENRWRKHDVSYWGNALRKSNNKEIVNKELKGSDYTVSSERFENKPVAPLVTTEPDDDEQKEIEQILHENVFRRYTSSGNSYTNVDAIPISFVGDYMAFYRTGHKIINATPIITGTGDSVKMSLPSELHIGDFIVVRESDKDIIRDLADAILKNSGKSELRSLASKWKEVLEIEMLFSTVESFYERLSAAGCTKGFQTVKRWIEDDEIIAPQQKQDLQYIAEVTDSDVLKELIDKIFDASREVKAAHTKAGRILSIQLQRKVVEELKNYGTIDQFNIWEPIEMDVDEIGTVKVLKIIDISSVIKVDASDTNRLIEE